jgi:hypothetical protein
MKEKGKDLVLPLRAAEPLFEELQQTVETLLHHLQGLSSSHLTELNQASQLRKIRDEVRKLEKDIAVAVETSGNPWDTFHEGIYAPKIKPSLEIVAEELNRFAGP